MFLSHDYVFVPSLKMLLPVPTRGGESSRVVCSGEWDLDGSPQGTGKVYSLTISKTGICQMDHYLQDKEM